MMKVRSLLLSIVIILGIRNTALAQDFSPMSTPFYHATADTLNLYPYRHSGDLLALLPGLWLRDTGATGQWTSSQASGMTMESSRILIDGQPISDPWSGINNLTHLSAQMIREIHYYPQGDPLGFYPGEGVVSIQTRNVESSRPYTRILYRTGSGKFSDLDVTFGQKISRRWEFYSGAMIKRYGENLPLHTYKGQYIHSKITFKPWSRGILMYTIRQAKADLDTPLYFSLPGDTTLDPAHKKSLRYDHLLRFSAGTGKLVTRIDLTLSDYDWEFREPDFVPAAGYEGRKTGLMFRQELSLPRTVLAWGVRTHKFRVSHPSAFSIERQNTLGMLQIHLTPASLLDWYSQIHVNRISDGKTGTGHSHRISLALSRHGSLEMGYARSFRNPTLGEMLGQPFYLLPAPGGAWADARQYPNNLDSNFGLAPEISENLEGRILFTLSEGITLSGRLFHNRITDRIIPHSTYAGWQFTNMGSARLRGFTFWAATKLPAGFQTYISGTLQDTEDEEGLDLAEQPPFYGIISVLWSHPFFNNELRVSLMLSARYWNSYTRWTASQPPEKESGGPGTETAVKLTLHVQDRFSATASIDNLLNETDVPVWGFSRPSRSYRIGVNWALLD
jgi:outer membrane receptor protein involved in Fe transport